MGVPQQDWFFMGEQQQKGDLLLNKTLPTDSPKSSSLFSLIPPLLPPRQSRIKAEMQKMLEINTESQRYHRLFRIAPEEILKFYEGSNNEKVKEA